MAARKTNRRIGPGASNAPAVAPDAITIKGKDLAEYARQMDASSRDTAISAVVAPINFLTKQIEELKKMQAETAASTMDHSEKQVQLNEIQSGLTAMTTMANEVAKGNIRTQDERDTITKAVLSFTDTMSRHAKNLERVSPKDKKAAAQARTQKLEAISSNRTEAEKYNINLDSQTQMYISDIASSFSNTLTALQNEAAQAAAAGESELFDQLQDRMKVLISDTSEQMTRVQETSSEKSSKLYEESAIQLQNTFLKRATSMTKTFMSESRKKIKEELKEKTAEELLDFDFDAMLGSVMRNVTVGDMTNSVKQLLGMSGRSEARSVENGPDSIELQNMDRNIEGLYQVSQDTNAYFKKLADAGERRMQLYEAEVEQMVRTYGLSEQDVVQGFGQNIFTNANAAAENEFGVKMNVSFDTSGVPHFGDGGRVNRKIMAIIGEKRPEIVADAGEVTHINQVVATTAAMAAETNKTFSAIKELQSISNKPQTDDAETSVGATTISDAMVESAEITAKSNSADVKNIIDAVKPPTSTVPQAGITANNDAIEGKPISFKDRFLEHQNAIRRADGRSELEIGDVKTSEAISNRVTDALISATDRGPQKVIPVSIVDVEDAAAKKFEPSATTQEIYEVNSFGDRGAARTSEEIYKDEGYTDLSATEQELQQLTAKMMQIDAQIEVYRAKMKLTSDSAERAKSENNAASLQSAKNATEMFNNLIRIHTSELQTLFDRQNTLLNIEDQEKPVGASMTGPGTNAMGVVGAAVTTGLASIKPEAEFPLSVGKINSIKSPEGRIGQAVVSSSGVVYGKLDDIYDVLRGKQGSAAAKAREEEQKSNLPKVPPWLPYVAAAIGAALDPAAVAKALGKTAKKMLPDKSPKIDLRTKAKKLFDDIKRSLRDFAEKWKERFKRLGSYISEKVDEFKNGFKRIRDRVKNFFVDEKTGKYTSMKEKWKQISEAFEDAYKKAFPKGMWQRISSSLQSGFNNVREGLDKAGKSLSSWGTSSVNNLKRLEKTFERGLDDFGKKIRSLASGEAGVGKGAAAAEGSAKAGANVVSKSFFKGKFWDTFFRELNNAVGLNAKTLRQAMAANAQVVDQAIWFREVLGGNMEADTAFRGIGSSAVAGGAFGRGASAVGGKNFFNKGKGKGIGFALSALVQVLTASYVESLHKKAEAGGELNIGEKTALHGSEAVGVMYSGKLAKDMTKGATGAYKYRAAAQSKLAGASVAKDAAQGEVAAKTALIAERTAEQKRAFTALEEAKKTQGIVQTNFNSYKDTKNAGVIMDELTAAQKTTQAAKDSLGVANASKASAVNEVRAASQALKQAAAVEAAAAAEVKVVSSSMGMLRSAGAMKSLPGLNILGGTMAGVDIAQSFGMLGGPNEREQIAAEQGNEAYININQVVNAVEVLSMVGMAFGPVGMAVTGFIQALGEGTKALVRFANPDIDREMSIREEIEKNRPYVELSRASGSETDKQLKAMRLAGTKQGFDFKTAEARIKSGNISPEELQAYQDFKTARGIGNATSRSAAERPMTAEENTSTSRFFKSYANVMDVPGWFGKEHSLGVGKYERQSEQAQAAGIQGEILNQYLKAAEIRDEKQREMLRETITKVMAVRAEMDYKSTGKDTASALNMSMIEQFRDVKDELKTRLGDESRKDRDVLTSIGGKLLVGIKGSPQEVATAIENARVAAGGIQDIGARTNAYAAIAKYISDTKLEQSQKNTLLSGLQMTMKSGNGINEKLAEVLMRMDETQRGYSKATADLYKSAAGISVDKKGKVAGSTTALETVIANREKVGGFKPEEIDRLVDQIAGSKATVEAKAAIYDIFNRGHEEGLRIVNQTKAEIEKAENATPAPTAPIVPVMPTTQAVVPEVPTATSIVPVAPTAETVAPTATTASQTTLNPNGQLVNVWIKGTDVLGDGTTSLKKNADVTTPYKPLPMYVRDGTTLTKDDAKLLGNEIAKPVVDGNKESIAEQASKSLAQKDSLTSNANKQYGKLQEMIDSVAIKEALPPALASALGIDLNSPLVTSESTPSLINASPNSVRVTMPGQSAVTEPSSAQKFITPSPRPIDPRNANISAAAVQKASEVAKQKEINKDESKFEDNSLALLKRIAEATENLEKKPVAGGGGNPQKPMMAPQVPAGPRK